jgi:hypothetical protein
VPRPHRIYMNVLAVVVPELKFRDVQQARGMTSPRRAAILNGRRQSWVP